MPKYFLKSPIDAKARSIRLDGETAHHLSHVLRMKIGEAVTLCDGQETDYDCVIEQITTTKPSATTAKGLSITLSIRAVRTCDTEPATKIILFQSLPKGDKLEWIIQKCVELGIRAIVPVITEHSVVRVNKDWHTKIERYQRIAEAAAAQSMRGIIPLVHEPLPLMTALTMCMHRSISAVDVAAANMGAADVAAADVAKATVGAATVGAADVAAVYVAATATDVAAINVAATATDVATAAVVTPVKTPQDFSTVPQIDLHLFAYEKERQMTIPQALRGLHPATIGLWIGPEGGFSDDEAACFHLNSLISTAVTLGKRILRTETAGMTALTQALCALEDI